MSYVFTTYKCNDAGKNNLKRIKIVSNSGILTGDYDNPRFCVNKATL